MSEVYEKLMKCYKSVREKTDFVPEAALILGSGLGDYADDRKSRHRSTMRISKVFRYPQ